jgi:hypothetical protein
MSDALQDDNPVNIEIARQMPLTVRYARRTITMHTVTSVELDTVASLSNSIHLTFFGISMGALIAFVIVISTVEINNATQHATFIALLAVSVLSVFYFGVRAVSDYRSAKRKVREIKQSEPTFSGIS